MADESFLPKYLIERTTHELLQKNINENEMINNLLNNADDIISQSLNILLESIKVLLRTIKFKYCISGSKAWYETFKDFSDNLSIYEKSAIYKYNNWDFHFIIDNNLHHLPGQFNKDGFNYYMIQYLERFINTLNQNIPTIPDKHFLIKLKTNSKSNFLFKDSIIYIVELYVSDDVITDAIIEEINKNDDDIQEPSTADGAAFSVASVASITSSRQSAARKRKITKEKQLEEEKKEKEEKEKQKELARQSRSERAAKRLSTTNFSKKGGIGENIIKKRIFTFEFNICETINKDYHQRKQLFDNFDKLYDITTNILNIYGLYIFNQICKKRFYIERKLYNQYKIRDAIYDKLVIQPQPQELKTKGLFDIVKLYELTFKDLLIPNKFLYSELQRQALMSNSEIEIFVNEIEANIIECMRPYINQAIININEDIKTLKFLNKKNEEILGEHISGIYVAGGDAMRRFKFNASLTKDIDTKIYIPEEISLSNKHNQEIIDDCIIKNMFILLIHFIYNKNTIFSSIDIPDKLTISIPNVEAVFKLVSSDPNNFNFRFRKLLKSKFPVDLYSLDYSTNINFGYNIDYNGEMRNIVYNHKYDIAFLDVVLEQSEENYFKKYAVFSTNNLPVSSIEFLLDDLKKTYNKDESSLLRFQQGKINKDYQRYLDLYEIINKNIVDKNSEYSIDSVSKVITYTKDIQKQNNSILDAVTFIDKRTIIADELFTHFNKLYINSQKNTTKIVFSYEKPEELLSGGAFQNIVNKNTSISNYQPFINQSYKAKEKITDDELLKIYTYINYVIQPKKYKISKNNLKQLRRFIRTYDYK